MAVLKFLILLGILLYASIKDLREHEVPNTVWKLIAVLGLVNISLRDLPSMLLGAALVFSREICYHVDGFGSAADGFCRRNCR